MSARRCLVITSMDDLPAALTANDREEIATFADFLRRARAAETAGATADEAATAIYPDSYPDAEGGAS